MSPERTVAVVVLWSVIAVGAGCGGASGGGNGGDGGSSSSGGGSGSSSGGGGCDAACGSGRLCCGSACVNPDNDPFNCGACGVKCTGGTPYCDGSCKPDACTNCTPDQICCKSEGPVGGAAPTCYTPTPAQPTCGVGCAPQCVSDRNLKRDIEPVDEQEILERVASMPESTWSYRSDDPSVRHLGPMAQDFRAAFGLGDTDRAYDPIDAHGVAFAAIKALAERLEAQSARIERLERENAPRPALSAHRQP
jgi:hypothetical protein